MALRTPLSVTPHLYMGDSTGRPLDNGVVYFGQQDKDPEYYPITLYSDDALTLPLMQPVNTKGGYLYDKGDMVEPHAKEVIYSVKVLDSYGRKVFYKGAMMRNSWNDDVIAQINQAIIDSQQDVASEAAKAVQVAIDATAVEGGVLVDTFVTATAKAPAMIARTQKQVNAQTITPYDFGVKGGFNLDTLGTRFATIALAKDQYPNAVALTELADRVAFDAFLLYLIANKKDGVDISCQIYLDKPLTSYLYANTKVWSGNLELKSYTNNLEYCLHVSTPYVVHTGKIIISGSQSDPYDMRTRRIKHGVVFGNDTTLGLTGDAPNCKFSYIEGESLLGFTYLLSANCHFTSIGTCVGRNNGSAQINAERPLLQGVGDTFTSVTTTGADISQRSKLSIPNMQLQPRMFLLRQNRVVIDYKPYDIMAVDWAAKTIDVYPALPTSKTTGSLLHVFGGAAAIYSNNTACSTIDVLQGVVCGYTLFNPALYGVAINSFTSEFNGIAIGVAGRDDPHIGTNISLAYFESNYVDILYGWDCTAYGAVNINQSIGLVPEKIWNLYGYTIGENSIASRSYMGRGTVAVNGVDFKLDGNMFDLSEPSTSNLYEDIFYLPENTNIQLSYNPKVNELRYLTSKIIHLKPNGNDDGHKLTLLPPSGMTINDAASLVINMSNYIGLITVAFSVELTRTNKNIRVVVSGQKRVRKGITALRPIDAVIGQAYYDTTLLEAGKPITWNGANWVDLLGATV